MLRYQLCGRTEGDFNPSCENFIANLDVVRVRLGLGVIFAPKANFTNRVVVYGPEDRATNHIWFHRMPEDADGGIVKSRGVAIAFFNADCPLIAVRDGERLAALHGGFRCLWPRSRDEGGIIQALFKSYQFAPEKSEVFVGYGIGPCCYGMGFNPEIVEMMQDGMPLGKATRGPRAGQISIDLYRLICQQLIAEGVPAKNITIDYTCTACKGLPAQPQFYSNCRRDTGRNAALVWLD